MNICSMASEHMFMCQRTYVRGRLNLCTHFPPNFNQITRDYIILLKGYKSFPSFILRYVVLLKQNA